MGYTAIEALVIVAFLFALKVSGGVTYLYVLDFSAPSITPPLAHKPPECP
jgi:hypothetical protein